MKLPVITSTVILLSSGAVVSSYFVSPRTNHHGALIPSINSRLSPADKDIASSGMKMFLGQKSSQKTADLKTSDTTKIGNTVVPSIGIGTISWSSDSLTSLESLELQLLVNTACRENAAFFDTAERYGGKLKTALGLGWGETEMLTNKLLENASANASARITASSSSNRENTDRSAVPAGPLVATKFTPSPWRTTPESVVEACKQSCKRLGVEKIGLYQLHMPDIVKPFRAFGFAQESLDEVYWEGLAQCYQQGLVSNVGVSNYGPTLVTQCKEFLNARGVPLASNQIAYSLLGRGNGAQETVDKCNELDVKVLAAFPFAMGILTGKYNSDSLDYDQSSSTMAEDTITSLTNSRKTNFELRDLNRYAKGDGENIPQGGVAPLLSIMESIAKRRSKTVAQVALNYCVSKGTIPIPGARTQAQLSDNLGAMGWRLTPYEIRLLEEKADTLGFEFEGAGFKRTSEKFVGYGVEKWTLD